MPSSQHRSLRTAMRNAVWSGGVVLTAVTAGVALVATLPPAAAQTNKQWLAPNVQIRGAELAPAAAGKSSGHGAPDQRAPGHRAPDRRPAGIEGFGYSTFDIQNQSDQPNDVLVMLMSHNYPTVNARRTLPPRGAASVAMTEVMGTRNGSYWASVNSDQASRPIIRTLWPKQAGSAETAGAAAGYEAPETALEMVLPMVIRKIQGHVTSFYVQNPVRATNYVTMEIFNTDDGSIEKSFTLIADPESVDEYEMNETTFSRLPTNVADGYVGSIYFRSVQPFSVMAIGDEEAGEGAIAYDARPLAAADKRQFLPLVRANMLGDSYLAIANTEYKKASVTLTYRGAADSPSGAGVTFTQKIDIKARASAYIDLSARLRGTATFAGLPRGGGLNQGFVGSAVIESNTKIMAIGWDSTYDPAATKVRTGAAYNAYGPADLGTVLAVPRLARTSGGRTSTLYLMNPGTAAATAQIHVTNADAGLDATDTVELAAGESRRWVYRAAAASAQAEIQSSAPLAVLVYETAMLEPADWGKSWGIDTLAYAAVAMPGSAVVPTRVPPTATPTRVMTPTDLPPTGSPTPTRESTPVPPTPAATATPKATTSSRGIFLPVAVRAAAVGGR